MFDVLLGRFCDLEICEDNQATIRVVKNGFSNKLRHVTRTHKVNVAGLSELLEDPSIALSYIDTKEQAADIFTKALSPQLWGSALNMLGLNDQALPPWPG